MFFTFNPENKSDRPRVFGWYGGDYEPSEILSLNESLFTASFDSQEQVTLLLSTPPICLAVNRLFLSLASRFPVPPLHHLQQLKSLGVDLALQGQAELPELPPKLVQLQLTGPLANLPVLPATVRYLCLSANKDLQAWPNLDGAPYLTQLNLDYNRIGEVPQKLSYPHLTALSLVGNGLTSLPPLSLNSLHRLSLDHNHLSALPPLHLPALTSLSLAHNRFQAFGELTGCPRLACLLLTNNPLTTFPPVLSLPLQDLRLTSSVAGELIYARRDHANLLAWFLRQTWLQLYFTSALSCSLPLTHALLLTQPPPLPSKEMAGFFAGMQFPTFGL